MHQLQISLDMAALLDSLIKELRVRLAMFSVISRIHLAEQI